MRLPILNFSRKMQSAAPCDRGGINVDRIVNEALSFAYIER